MLKRHNSSRRNHTVIHSITDINNKLTGKLMGNTRGTDASGNKITQSNTGAKGSIDAALTRSDPEGIRTLALLLHERLVPYVLGNFEARTALMDACGGSLIEVDALLHALTRSPMEREQRIVGQQIFLEIQQERKEA